jgi:uncharacterized protein (TIGR03435 family)
MDVDPASARAEVVSAMLRTIVCVTAFASTMIPVSSAIRAQTPAPTRTVSFDAATVKLNTSGSERGDDEVTAGGRYMATNLSLRFLIRFAYARSPRSRGLEPFEVSGGPDWTALDRFDVEAVAGRDVSLSELRAMLQTLLIERFKLRTHYETRPSAVYRLTLATPATLGPKLRRATADCAGVPVDPRRGIRPGQAEPCGYFGPSPTAPMDSGRAYQAFRGLTMEDLALRLYPYLGRRIIDGTGLSGYFDADFEFTSEIVMPPPPGPTNPYDGRLLPSIVDVLPQQLGLRLQSERGTIEILVIDEAERPARD